ncbi:MAG: hypothetical protein OHK0013_03430 [Sandaracinaceae bacterium]
MPHRDDREAARRRIEALERELEETKARAAREVAEARALAERGKRSRRGRERAESAEATTSGVRTWAEPFMRRFRIGAAIAVVLLDLPTVVLLAGWRWDLDDADEGLLGWTLLPALILIPVLYVLARSTRAPFPASAAISSVLASGVGWFTILAGASDMVWRDVLAEPPWRWLTRGACGLLGIAAHAFIVSHWCTEAALHDVGSGD